MTDAFEAGEVRFSFTGLTLLKGITFRIPRGGMFVIAGRSGCGKSTLLELCSSQRSPDSGTIRWEGLDVADFTHDALMRARRRIGVVFQKHALIHNFTVFDNIALPLRYHRNIPEREVRATVKASMEELGLFGVDARFPNELSAAQSRCAAIARAVVMGPAIVFLDEPTAGVDPVSARGMANVLLDMNRSRGISFLVMCNSADTIRQLECPTAILDNGNLYDIQDPRTAHTGAADLLAALRENL